MALTKVQNKSGKFVGSKHVDTLLSTYKKERWAANSRKLGQADSLSVFYSLDELQAFIDEARMNGADGVKMYFGVYTPDTAAEERFEGRQTIVLVASKTKTLPNGSSIDKSIFVNRPGGAEILAFNQGRICPPACTGDDTGTGSTGFDIDNPGVLIDQKEGGMIVI